MAPIANTTGWTRFIGSTSYEGDASLAVAANGELYVAGTSYGSIDGYTNAGDQDIFLSKFSQEGSKIWTSHIGGRNADIPYAMAASEEGGVYVVGYTQNALSGKGYGGGSSDAFIIKLTAKGEIAWTQQTIADGNQRYTDITQTGDTSIYTTGWNWYANSLDGENAIGEQDAVLSKYTASGQLQWTRILGSSGNERANALTTSDDGSIYITGNTTFSSSLNGQITNGGDDAFIAKYSSDGTRVWTRVIGSTGNEQANDITTDPEGFIYIVGYTGYSAFLEGQKLAGGDDGFISKFSPDGKLIWTRIVGSTAGENALSVSYRMGDRTLVVAGLTNGNLNAETNNGGYDGYVATYDKEGNLLSTKLVGGPDLDYIEDIAVRFDGSVVATGGTNGSFAGGTNSGSRDIFLTLMPLNNREQPTPTYSLSTSSSSINEGSTLTTTVSTTNVNPGTTLYYSLSGSGISSADFSAGSLLGSGVLSNSGSFSFSHTLANDLTTEGTETLEIKLFSDSARSTQVGSTASVSIRDTSTTQSNETARLNSLSLSGTNYGTPWEYVVVKDSPSLSISGEYSIATWVYRKNAGGDWRNVYDIPGAHLLEFSPGGGFDWRAENNNIDFNINGPLIDEGRWTHVAATMTASGGGYKADIYVDGKLANSSNGWQLGSYNNNQGVRDSDADLYLGILWSQRNGNPDPWAGNLDDFQIWNKGLSASEIERVFEGDLAVRKDNLVAQYTFENDEGTKIIDSSGKGNHGTAVSKASPPAPSPAPPTAPSGGGFLDLAGDTYSSPWEYMVVRDSSSLSITGEYTIASWVYRSDAGGDWRNLYDIPGAHLLEFSPEGGFDWRAENNNMDFNVNGPQIGEGQWRHIAATMSQTSNGYRADIYVDGQLASSSNNWQVGARNNNTGVRDSDSDLYLGILWSQRQGNPDPWAGGIDNFMIWNKSLSQAEIIEVKSNNANIQRSNLVAEYTFNNVSENTVFDSSGKNNHGTLVGAKVIAKPTYSLSTSSSSLNEGSTLTTTVSTTNVNAGTTLYYALSGNGITSADFSAGSLLGSGVVSSSGSFSFSHTLANDLTTEGTETLEIKLFSDSARSTQVGSTASVSIRDTSTTPAPTYSLSVTPSVLGEGESFSSIVATTNLAAGTKLYYALSGTGITESDFRPGDRVTGFGTINANGSFSFSHTLANDLTTEGTETLEIKLFSDSNLSQQVGNAQSVIVYDTSTTPAPISNPKPSPAPAQSSAPISNPNPSPTPAPAPLSNPISAVTNNNSNNSKNATIAPTTTNNVGSNLSFNTNIGSTSTTTYNVSNTYAKNLVGDVLTGSAQLNQNSYDAKFYNLGGGRYGVQQKGKSTIDEITGATSLQFQDQAISLASDVAATFNQVKGIDDVSGVVFRLYNAAFARLPDANGLENWINGNKSGGQTYASSALEFAKSQEFKNRYGSNVSDTQYVTTLYNNVLGRVPDAGGLAHYQGLLASGKDRGSLLLDFSESPENRTLFTKVTGLS